MGDGGDQGATFGKDGQRQGEGRMPTSWALGGNGS